MNTFKKGQIYRLKMRNYDLQYEVIDVYRDVDHNIIQGKILNGKKYGGRNLIEFWSSSLIDRKSILCNGVNHSRHPLTLIFK